MKRDAAASSQTTGLFKKQAKEYVDTNPLKVSEADSMQLDSGYLVHR